LVHVAVAVFDHGPAVTVELIARRLDDFGSGVDGALVGGVNVVDIDVEKRGEVFAFPEERNHQILFCFAFFRLVFTGAGSYSIDARRGVASG
jgi:hypothetical protein